VRQDYLEIASFTRNDKPACVCPHADKRGTNTCNDREEKRGLLFHGDAFGQVSGLVHMTASFYGNMIGQELQGKSS